MSIVVRYAKDDVDVAAIHRFLCIAAAPTLPGPIDPAASVAEIWRVANRGAALIAHEENEIVGTLGLISPEFWWNPHYRFLANRWFFARLGSLAGRPLLREACAVARASGIELHIFDEQRERLVIFNKSKSRQEKPDVLR